VQGKDNGVEKGSKVIGSRQKCTACFALMGRQREKKFETITGGGELRHVTIKRSDVDCNLGGVESMIVGMGGREERLSRKYKTT